MQNTPGLIIDSDGNYQITDEFYPALDRYIAAAQMRAAFNDYQRSKHKNTGSSQPIMHVKTVHEKDLDDVHKEALDQRLKNMAEWDKLVTKLAIKKGFETNKALYEKAGVDRRTFSKVLYTSRPSKDTAVRLGIALRLTKDEMIEFLALVGHALSEADMRDVIILYFLELGCHDFFTIDQAMVHYNCDTFIECEYE